MTAKLCILAYPWWCFIFRFSQLLSFFSIFAFLPDANTANTMAQGLQGKTLESLLLLLRSLASVILSVCPIQTLLTRSVTRKAQIDWTELWPSLEHTVGDVASRVEKARNKSAEMVTDKVECFPMNKAKGSGIESLIRSNDYRSWSPSTVWGRAR